MLEAIESLEALKGRYDAVLCDVWGVVHDGRRSFAPACAALARFRAAGGLVLLLTNAPKPRGPLPGQLDRLGVPREAWDGIVTSGDATRMLLAERAPGPMHRIGPPKDEALWEGLGLAEAPISQAAFLAVSGLREELNETPESYAEELAAARARGLTMICANPDIVVRFGERLIYCAGALAEVYAAMGGEVLMGGKPHAPIYALARRELAQLAGREIPSERILAIGDGPATDLAGANREGLDALFVAAGIHGESLRGANGAVDVARAEAALREAGVAARYVLGALC